MFFIIAGTIGFVIVLASLIKSWEERDRYPDQPLYSVKERELCQEMHTWAQAAFLSTKEMKEVEANPILLEAKKTNFCRNCGYVPTLERMVKRQHLDDLNAHLEVSKRLHKKTKDINELSEDFFRSISTGVEMTTDQRVYFRAGYDAHRTFVDNLPELLISKEKLENLQKIDKIS